MYVDLFRVELLGLRMLGGILTRLVATSSQSFSEPTCIGYSHRDLWKDNSFNISCTKLWYVFPSTVRVYSYLPTHGGVRGCHLTGRFEGDQY